MNKKFSHIVIYHGVDMDGWVSADIVKTYLNQQGVATENIFFYGWDYGESYGTLACVVEQNPDADIFMVDICLPDLFMRLYAHRIIWIDHHESSIARMQQLELSFKKSFSTVKLNGFKGMNGKDAKQISACELCWVSLMGDDVPIPLYVHLAGRYDVWDHDADVLAFNMFTRTQPLPPHKSKPRSQRLRFNEPWFVNLKTPHGIGDAIQQGKQALRWKERLDAVDSRRNTEIMDLFGHKVAIFNRPYVNSLFFDAVCKNDNSIDVAMSYSYQMSERMWSVSCFSINQSVSALTLIQNFRNHMNVITMGGHQKACGFSFKESEFERFRNCFIAIDLPQHHS